MPLPCQTQTHWRKVSVQLLEHQTCRSNDGIYQYLYKLQLFSTNEARWVTPLHSPRKKKLFSDLWRKQITPAPAHQLLMDESLQVIRKNNETWSQGEWILVSKKNLIKEELATLLTHYAKKIIVLNPWAQKQQLRPPPPEHEPPLGRHLRLVYRLIDIPQLVSIPSSHSTHSPFFCVWCVFSISGWDNGRVWRKLLLMDSQRNREMALKERKKAPRCIPGTAAVVFYWVQTGASKMTPAIITNKSCDCFFFHYCRWARIERSPKGCHNASAEPCDKGLYGRGFFFFPSKFEAVH